MPITIHPLVKQEKSFEGFSTFSSGSHLVHLSGRFEQFWLEGHPRIIHVKLFEIYPLVKKKTFKGFSVLSSGDHLVHPSRMV